MVAAAVGKSASLGPNHGLLSTTNADHHHHIPRQRSSLSYSDGGNCQLKIACGGTAIVIDYFSSGSQHCLHDSHYRNIAVAVNDTKKAYSATNGRQAATPRTAAAFVRDRIDAITGTGGHTSSTLTNALSFD